MTFRRVSPGEPLEIAATTWNQLAEGLQQGPGNGAVPGKSFRASVTVSVRNDTGADLPQFGVVGLGDLLIDPDDGEGEFLNSIVFAGVLAAGGDYDLKWGLTLAPIEAGKIGTIVVQGLCYAKLDTEDATEAGPASDGDVEALTSVSCGLARVLWREAGGGNKWAIVCLG